MMKKALLGLTFTLLTLPVGSFAGETPPPGPPSQGKPHQFRPLSAADQIRNCSTLECKKRMADTIPLIEEMHSARIVVLRELAKEKPSESVIEKAEEQSQAVQKKLFELHKRTMPRQGDGRPAPPVGQPSGSAQ
ncbi:hypothetical protein FY034_17825 (plasmid) [Trichlorobacter lovleyi]|uniref:hypothetical protein n=1 Tax=Trichlorobacter lovleyi TaxID=313985 RepID=UPI00223F1568|nr:hypothetical protein [Trichlorobacter lovleyi]QOX80881.1 hypothetical protein FY034_17825 [Trichlorobacter lovleyi]